jgi:O-antigen ligase
MMFTVMMRTSSRGGFLGMVAIMAGLLFIGVTGRVREVRKVALTGIILAVLGAITLPASYTSRMRTMDEELDNQSPRARINVWKRGIGYAFDNPVLGLGMANFGRAEGMISEYSQERGGIGVKWSTAHSSYIEAWAEVGLIGGTAFLLAILGGTLSLMLWRPPPEMTDVAVRMLTPMVGLSLGAFAVAGAFLSFAFQSPPYYLLGFAVALLLVSGRKPGKEDSKTPVRAGSPARVRGPAPPVRPPPSRYPAPPMRVQPPPTLPGRRLT